MSTSETAPSGASRTFVGRNPERQEVGLPGHCDRCEQHGHVEAHPHLGCSDVGCDRSHSPDQIVRSRADLLAEVESLRAQHILVSRAPRLPEIEEALDQAYWLLGGCPHEYDDDWPFRTEEEREFAPGSKPGDPCVWCPEAKPATSQSGDSGSAGGSDA